jgi:hypothetical protein
MEVHKGIMINGMFILIVSLTHIEVFSSADGNKHAL